MTTVRDVIVHYHFFKNAGTTLAAVLQRQFGCGFATLEAEAGRKLNGSDLVQFLSENLIVTAVSSHTLWPPLPEIDSFRFHEILILRDPLDRVRSMYDFYRRSEIGSHPLSEKAKELDIQSFVKLLIADYAHVVSNAQLRMLIGGGRKARSDDLPRAVNFLKNIAVLGTVEHYNESLVAGQVRLCKAFPGLDLSYVPRNVSQRAGGLNERLARFEQMCGQDLWAQLSLLNELDAQLVAAANDESARRFRALASPEKILRDFQMRVWWRVQAASARDMLGRAWNFLRRRKDQMVNAGWILVHWCRQPFRHGDIRD